MNALKVPLNRPLVSMRYLAAVLGIPRETLVEVAENADQFYSPFPLTRVKNGREKTRMIDNPVIPLKSIQARIKSRLLDTIAFPEFMYGGVRKRSTQDNARKHVRKRQVVALDISDFFGSVTNAQVASVWTQRFGASTEAAWLLTRLTTFKGHLPQGAPTSTGLANLVILPAAEELNALGRLQGTTMTIYVDDITVSGSEATAAIPIVASVLGRHGFELARKKVKVMRANERQEVTGLTVNRRMSNGRATLKRARGLVLRAIGHGASEKEIQRARGLVAHVRATSPSQARWLLKKLEGIAPRASTAATPPVAAPPSLPEGGTNLLPSDGDAPET